MDGTVIVVDGSVIDDDSVVNDGTVIFGAGTVFEESQTTDFLRCDDSHCAVPTIRQYLPRRYYLSSFGSSLFFDFLWQKAVATW